MMHGRSIVSPMSKIQVSVVTDGLEQPLYRAPDGRLFVAGEPGQEYSLRVTNLTSRRVEIINTVDGRNTLKPEAGDLDHSHGLVFRSQQTGEFDGFRLDNDRVRKFVFTDPGQSVASQAGAPENIGVIAFAVHSELQTRPQPRIPYFPSGGDYPYTYGGSAMRGGPATLGTSRGGLESTTRGGQQIGTGMGDIQSSRVGMTHFDRDGNPADILVIHYNVTAVLEAEGIITVAGPNPFPGTGTGYEKYNPVR